ncbi:AAA family ATPase [Nocardia mangyaensis]|uniref:bifunctional aminoglycoside phosphotransferase/ATP-binding protein n=1 Tax=Nocardia mangyaensis TaxID=2213200 RepID=UPI0026771986|nr:AAA family ATPase [Nocardia mangyaensis]MDO3647702.1 AAA family ATPase [Nocardia mangyaensis]
MTSAPGHPRSPEPAQVHETHSGVVFLYGDRAYKVKKPLRTDFLDFSTTALRERACARELELNRRLDPDVYLGVAHLGDPAGGPAEPVLIMRRMPADRRLSVLLTQSGYPTDTLTALIHLLIRFHDEAERGPDIDRAGAATALRTRWRSLLDPLHDAPPDLVDPDLLARIDRRAMRYLDGRTPLLDQRIADGRIVDGHGDLLAEDIFELPEGFRVLDCLDFDDQLRYVDRLDDIAFLAMDFESLGQADLADRFVDDYLRESADPAPASLRDHYVAYRATVRAKVDVIRAGQGDRSAADRAREHLALAERRLRRGAVRLTTIGGLPGTGKSTVAAELSTRTGAVLISSDHVREELARVGAVSGPIGQFGAGRYSPGNKARVYDELLLRAEVLLASGVPVILDASWTDPEQRRRAAALADDVAAELVALQCVCPAELAYRRIRERHGSESDATPHIAEAIAATTSAWHGAVAIDTAGSLADSVAAACRVWHDVPDSTAEPVRCRV